MPPGHGPQAPRLLGRYELVVEVAKGQLGPLWLAHVGSELFGVRRVRTAAPIEPADAERLGSAARWSLEVRHENVAEVVDVVSTEGELGVVSKYVPGEPLRSLLRLSSFKRKPVPPEIAMRIGLDVLKGLRAVHEQARSDAHERIGSGGVNPDAILVTAPAGQALLLDVGIASVASGVPSLAQHPELGAYAAPEQVDAAKSADPRSDVFSLGVLLWEMICSRRLFAGASEAVIREKLSACAVPRLDAAAPVGGEPVAREIADVVARALSRDPADRYADAAAMSEAIEALGADALAERAAVAAMVEELAGQAIKTRAKLSSRAVAGKNAPVLGPRPQQATLVGIAPDDPAMLVTPRVAEPEPAPEPSTLPLPPAALQAALFESVAPDSVPAVSQPEPSSDFEVTVSEPEPSVPSEPRVSQPEPTTVRRVSSPELGPESGAISERELVEALTRESNPGPPPLDSIDFTAPKAALKPDVAAKPEAKLVLPSLTGQRAATVGQPVTRAPNVAPPPPAPALAAPPAPRAPELSDPLFEAPPSVEQILRKQKARKLVIGVVGGLAALLAVGLVISAVRSNDDTSASSVVREDTPEPPRPTPAVPAPEPEPTPAPAESATAAAATAAEPETKPDPKPQADDPPATERVAKPRPVVQKPRTEARATPKPAPKRPASAPTTSKTSTTTASKPKPKKPKYVPSGI